jgi:hypothetical protein
MWTRLACVDHAGCIWTIGRLIWIRQADVD